MPHLESDAGRGLEILLELVERKLAERFHGLDAEVLNDRVRKLRQVRFGQLVPEARHVPRRRPLRELHLRQRGRRVARRGRRRRRWRGCRGRLHRDADGRGAAVVRQPPNQHTPRLVRHKACHHLGDARQLLVRARGIQQPGAVDEAHRAVTDGGHDRPVDDLRRLDRAFERLHQPVLQIPLPDVPSLARDVKADDQQRDEHRDAEQRGQPQLHGDTARRTLVGPVARECTVRAGANDGDNVGCEEEGLKPVLAAHRVRLPPGLQPPEAAKDGHGEPGEDVPRGAVHSTRGEAHHTVHP